MNRIKIFAILFLLISVRGNAATTGFSVKNDSLKSIRLEIESGNTVITVALQKGKTAIFYRKEAVYRDIKIIVTQKDNRITEEVSKWITMVIQENGLPVYTYFQEPDTFLNLDLDAKDNSIVVNTNDKLFKISYE